MSQPTSDKRFVDVSAIVVTYNRNRPLQETLECLLKQDPAPREIIVVDQTLRHDAATQSFLKRLIELQSIRYIFQPEPNAQRARNRAISEACGEVLLFVDDDVVMDKTLVGAHWKNYQDPELAAVCGYYTEPGDQPNSELPPESELGVSGWIYFPHSYTKRTECYALPTCNGSLRKTVAMSLGGFDENYTHTLLDDTDLGARLKAFNLKVVHDPDARLVHLKETSGGNRPGGVNEYVIADSNRWYTWVYFFWTNFRWRAWRELGWRFRSTVFRGKNLTRPWYLALAFSHFVTGTARASGN
jgi:GT2 family glycosyltransferase